MRLRMILTGLALAGFVTGTALWDLPPLPEAAAAGEDLLPVPSTEGKKCITAGKCRDTEDEKGFNYTKMNWECAAGTLKICIEKVEADGCKSCFSGDVAPPGHTPVPK